MTLSYHVLVDDQRDTFEASVDGEPLSRSPPGAVIIRDPRVAVDLLMKMHGNIRYLGMDNDMGAVGKSAVGEDAWSFEGRNILKQYLDICANTDVYPAQVEILTSNIPALMEMQKQLHDHGYVHVERQRLFKRPGAKS